MLLLACDFAGVMTLIWTGALDLFDDSVMTSDYSQMTPL